MGSSALAGGGLGKCIAVRLVHNLKLKERDNLTDKIEHQKWPPKLIEIN